MINGSWDIVVLVLIVRIPGPQPFYVANCAFKIVFWIETKGRTLEEIDEIFDGEKHSSVPDVEMIRKGQATIDVGAIEQQLKSE